MADINQVISLGIGSPSAIKYFISFGLSIGTLLAGAGSEISMIYNLCRRRNRE